MFLSKKCVLSNTNNLEQLADRAEVVEVERAFFQEYFFLGQSIQEWTK